MVPRKTLKFRKRIRTPDTFESRALRATTGSGLLPAEYERSGPLPLLDGQWPFGTTGAFPETGGLQAQCERIANFPWAASLMPVTKHQVG